MAPKSGNAFAQQKDLQRQQEPDAKNPEVDMPASPMTTMSMFLPPDLTPINYLTPTNKEVPAEPSTFLNAGTTPKHTTGRRKQGQRAFTDPTAAVNAQSAGPSEPSAVSKQSSGLNYLKSKFAGKSKKSKDPELAAQDDNNPASSENLSSTPGSGTLRKTRRTDVVPDAITTTASEDFRGQNHPSHLSTMTTRTFATSESRYVSPLQNDAMILGNVSMSPTRSGSYAMTGQPTIVNASRPNIMSFQGSVHGAPSQESSPMTDPNMVHAPLVPSGYYDNSYIAPLPPPPGEEFQAQSPFYHQLPIYLRQDQHQHVDQTNRGGQQVDHPNREVYDSGTWEQLHAQHPMTMPQYSPLNRQPPRQEIAGSASFHAPDDTEETEEQEIDMSEKNSQYNAGATDSKSEPGMEALEAREDEGDADAEPARTPLGSRPRSIANPEGISQVDPNRTPVPNRMYKPPTTATGVSQLSPKMPLSRPSAGEPSMSTMPTMLNPDRDTTSPTGRQDREPTEGRNPHGNEGFAVQSYGNPTMHGGNPPTPQQPQHQARSSFEEQMAGEVFLLHRHLDDVQHNLSRLMEQLQIDKAFMPMFRQLCLQSNGFRDYLHRIQNQTANLRPLIVSEMVAAITALEQRMREEQHRRLASHERRMREEHHAHEQRMRDEHTVINNNILKLHHNDYARQKHMGEMDKKIDLLLKALGVNTLKEGQSAEKENKEHAPPGALDATAPAPITQVETPTTKNRKATPVPAKLPIMAANLTSTPPHVPQLPHSQSSSSRRMVTITDPNIPSPSAVSSARRLKHGHHRDDGEAKKENRRAGLVGQGSADASAVKESGTNVHPALRKEAEAEKRRAGSGVQGSADAAAVAGSVTNVHPALRAHHEEMKKRAAGKKEQEGEEEKLDEATTGEEVLWRKPSGDGEIGSAWYKAATQE